MELVPEQIAGAVIINVMNPCTCSAPECGNCSDYAVGLHNWLVSTGLKYVIFDLQDEKEVCSVFIEEVLQLWKRMRFPFLFSGVMPKPRSVLQSYSYDTRFPFFATPDEAVDSLRQKVPGAMVGTINGVAFGQAIAITRPRLGLRDADGEVIDDENPPEAED